MSLRTAPRHLNPLTCRRPFITLPSSGPQTLVATRTLPYRAEPLYDLIADVDSYSSFVPFCSRSRVTHWSARDSSGRSWPTLADLHVSWGGFSEVFTSRVRCVPGVSVEAFSSGDVSAVFKSLETLWSLNSLHPSSTSAPSSPLTEVRLTINYHFVNPLYAAISAAVSDQMASIMIEAFEKQVHQRLKRHPSPPSPSSPGAPSSPL